MAQASLAELLEQQRLADGIPSATALAARLGVNQSTASRWLRGEPVGDEHLQVVADFLGLDPRDVLMLSLEARHRRLEIRARYLVEVEEAAAARDGFEPDTVDYNSRIARMPDSVRQVIDTIIDAEEAKQRGTSS